MSPPRVRLTVSSRGRLSLTAPTQPKQPITMMTVPTAMSKLAADREGRDDDRVAKFPWVTESQTPTPRMPHPPNCRGNTKEASKADRETAEHCQNSSRTDAHQHRKVQRNSCRTVGTCFIYFLLKFEKWKSSPQKEHSYEQQQQVIRGSRAKQSEPPKQPS